MPVLFNASVEGIESLRAKGRAIQAGAALALSKGQIENFILQRTRARFAPKGTTPTAQKDPDGRAWEPSPESTIRRRDINKKANQALYESGALAHSLRISKQNTFLGAIRSTAGGSAIIGVSRGNPAYKYASLMQNGGHTPRGGRIPPRRFIGIGDGDVKVIDAFLYNTMDKAVR